MLTALVITAAIAGFRPANAEECRVYAAATGGLGGYNIASALEGDSLPGLLPQDAALLETEGPALALWPCGLPMGAPPLSRPEGERGYISRPIFNRRHDRAFVLIDAGCSITRIDLTRDRRGRWIARPSNIISGMCEPGPPLPVESVLGPQPVIQPKR